MNKLRISPIEHPKSLLGRYMYRLLKKQFGKTLMPAKVIYVRSMGIGFLVRKIFLVSDKMKSLTEEEKNLVQHLVAALNGCSFCEDISKKRIKMDGYTYEKVDAITQYAQSDIFDERQKALFAYVEEMTLHIEVSDPCFQTLRTFYDDTAIIEITYIAASENFLNRLIKPFGIGSDELCSLD